MHDEALGYLSAVDLAAAIRARTVSPVEVTRAVLARIDRLNPTLNAFCVSMADEALTVAREAEAAVVAGHHDAAVRIQRARLATRENPVANAIVDRAAALAGDRGGLVPGAHALAAAGCHYQWARTLVFIGGSERQRGQAALAAMGAIAMAWPPG